MTRATGGALSPSTQYLVGEKGPEVVVFCECSHPTFLHATDGDGRSSCRAEGCACRKGDR